MALAGDPHPMTIRVMRLCAPAIGVPTAPSAASDCASLQEGTPTTAAQPSSLILPDGFGNIYTGQRFSSYITVLNHSDLQLSDVNLTAELQSEGARKVALEDRRLASGGTPRCRASTFPTGASLDTVVESFLTHVGAHILRVCVEYRDPMTGMPKEFRKFYRFTVQDPFSFNYKHHFMTGSSGSDDHAIVEVQVGNSTPHIINVPSMQLQTAPGFHAVPLFGAGVAAAASSDAGGSGGGAGGATAGGGGSGTSGDAASAAEPSAVDVLDVDGELQRRPVIAPGDIAQFVYRVTPDDVPSPGPSSFGSAGTPSRQWPAASTIEIGRLSVLWRMHMGEQGLWTSQPIMLRTPVAAAVSVSFASVPPSLPLDSSAAVDCIVANHSSFESVAARLQYVEPPHAGVVIDGLSSQNVGCLPPGGSCRVPLRIMGLSPGWHALQGLTVVDANSGASLPGGRPSPDDVPCVMVRAGGDAAS